MNSQPLKSNLKKVKVVAENNSDIEFNILLINKRIDQLISEIPELYLLSKDAVVHGRKLRSTLAFTLLKWTQWPINIIQKENLIDTLARIEILHSASCIIDDIIDGDKIRRGIPSFYIRNGFSSAIITSLILVKIGVSIKSNKNNIIRDKIEKIFEETLVGEAYDSFLLAKKTIKNIKVDLKLYLKKTIPCFEVAHEVAAYFAKRNDNEILSSANYGRLLGEYYQVTNDYYNWFYDDSLKRGNLKDKILVTYNLPIAFLIEDNNSYNNLLGSEILRSELLTIIKKSESLGVKQQCRNYIDKLKIDILNSFPGKLKDTELNKLLNNIDTAHFWNYEYEKK